MKIYTPANGEVVELKKVNDPVFSEKMMGEGFAVKPIDGKIHSPIKGTIKSVFPSLHALTIEAEDGLDLLIHIGLDTVELNGNGFSSIIQEGQKVKAGDLLVQIDRNYLAEHKKDDILSCGVFPEMKDKELETSLGEKQVGEIGAVIK
ncbi:MAG: PTS glucose transporter subunit IIA [Enterococcus raffinosus]